MNIINLQNFDMSSITFGEPKINVTGGQSIQIFDNNQAKLIFQTPKSYIPFGLNSFKPENGPTKYSIDLSLNTSTPAMNNFINQLKSFDNFLIQKAQQYSKTWFKKELNNEVIQELYKPVIKQNQNYAPMIKVKLPTDKNNNALCDIFDKHKNNTNIDYIEKGSYAQTIIECIGIYFIKKEFGTTWRIIQMKVDPPSKLSNYSFVDDDDTEDAEPI